MSKAVASGLVRWTVLVAFAVGCSPGSPVAPPPRLSPATASTRVSRASRAIVLGSAHACALMDDGTVRCWGLGRFGQLGSKAPYRARPEAVADLTGVTHLAAGSSHVCALLTDRTVRCWGQNTHGQLGDGTREQRDAPVPVRGLGAVVGLSAGAAHTCALLADGSLRCWGDDSHGQLGDAGTNAAVVAPVTVAALGAMTSVSAGASHTCARNAAAESWCWGDNRTHAIDDSAAPRHAVPVRVEAAKGAAEIVAGASLTCARDEHGTVSCWGSPAGGGAAFTRDGAPSSKPSPKLEKVVQLAVGTALGDETMHADYVGGRLTHDACGVLEDGRVSCLSQSDTTQALDLPEPTRPRIIPGIERARRVAMGAHHACAETQSGDVLCWGANGHGELGTGVADYVPLPSRVPTLTNVVALALGAMHACAIRQGGTVACWGDDAQGQLGPHAPAAPSVPKAVLGLDGVVELAAGDYHTCARTRSGAVACWGLDNAGQTGAPVRRAAESPGALQVVSGVNAATRVFAAGTRSCAEVSGAVLCWGVDGFSGNAGDDAHLPKPVPSLGALREVSLGGRHGCALTADATLACWGENNVGQLGTPPPWGRREERPVVVPALSRLASVSAGFGHTCVRGEDGRATCFGDRTFGELGVRPATGLPTPIPTLRGVRRIVAGNYATCALLADRTLRCFGLNGVGVLGDGTFVDRDVPTLVSGLSDVEDVVLGGTHACARLGDGTVACWGSNVAGQVGAPLAPPGPVRVAL